MYETALEILRKINKKGHRAYIVGGYPRDLYLNRLSTDIDICTSATPMELQKIFKKGILPKQEYGGVTVILSGIRFEITTFRRELEYESNRFPIKIEYINELVDDLERRDFTINTLCIDEEGRFIDLLNSKNDINNRIIKTVGNSDEKIRTDILRVLRAVRFATSLNFELDDELKKSIKKYKYLLKNLSYYRKKEELNRIFVSPNAKYGIELIKELELANDLELSNFGSLIVTVSTIAMWAQLGVVDIYNFTKDEKDTINKIKSLLNKDILDSYVLYKNGLYICSLVGEIKQIDRKLITKKYSELTIMSVNDIVLKGNDICELLNKNAGPYIRDILNDIEINILDGKLENDFNVLKQYVIDNYK